MRGERHRGGEPTQAQTETRGWDEYEDLDAAEIAGRDHYVKRPGAYVSQRQLEQRPFVGLSLATAVRCWCGRPLRDWTGRCREDHRPPLEPDACLRCWYGEHACDDAACPCAATGHPPSPRGELRA